MAFERDELKSDVPIAANVQVIIGVGFQPRIRA